MGRSLAAAAAFASWGIPAASVAAFFVLILACPAALLAASESRLSSPNTTDVQRPLWKDSPEQTIPNEGPPAKSGLHGSGGSRRNGSAATQESRSLPTHGVAEEAEESQLKQVAILPPAGPGGGGRKAESDPEAADMRTPKGDEDVLPVQHLSEGERNLCLGCPAGEAWEATLTIQRGELGPLEALSEVTRFARPLRDGARKELDGKGEGAGSQLFGLEGQEERGSGDQQAMRLPKKGSWARGTPLTPSLHLATEIGSLSHHSAETDLLLLDTVAGEAPASPTESSSGPRQILEQPPRRGLDQDSAQKEEPLELWVDASSRPPTLDSTNQTRLELGTPQSAVIPLVQAGQTPKPSSDSSASEIIDIDYYDIFDGEALGEAGPPEGGQGKPPKEKGTSSWSLHDLYDDFTPFDESDFYPTTSFYTDGDEEDLEEPEEEEEEDEDGGGGLERGLEDENDYRAPTLATPKIQTVALESEPTSYRYLVPPLQTFVISGGGHGVATPRPRPAEAGRDLSLLGGGNENGTAECRSGYIRHNNSCKSVCDAFPSYCYNGGQCYLVENLGAFCRCNTQDYIWHKGIRCESIITDFQVMCVAVGSAALVVLLLFMMTVFFAKKLYLLKTENNKLRKTKYRTPSELHNDNFSLSTIAEGSHPNEDPNALHKLQDPLKSCLKEEESFNIQNSMSPKLDHDKRDLDDSENCLQNNLT